MAISEKKMQIVMDNYFKAECTVNTSIREAFEKGFRIGVQKGYDVTKELKREKGQWNFIGDDMFECTHCGIVYTTQQLNGLRNYTVDPYAPRFCPNCGADMLSGWQIG